MVRSLFIILSISLPAGLLSQPEYPSERTEDLTAYLTFEESAPLSCLLTYFPPLFIQHGLELKQFIRSRSFRSIRTAYGDEKAIDAVYVRAMQLTNNNTGVSLLLSTVGCFDHEIVGINIPFFALAFPLTSESTEDFQRRVRNLPTRIYADSPRRGAGDRDKLQHFFGSAFLTFISESADAAERFGQAIEHGEDAFIVDGALDDRDSRANRHGQQYGLALLENNRRLPSEFLVVRFASGDALCAGGW